MGLASEKRLRGFIFVSPLFHIAPPVFADCMIPTTVGGFYSFHITVYS